RAAGARLGREREPVHEDGARHDRNAAPQARRRRAPAADRDRDRRRLPVGVVIRSVRVRLTLLYSVAVFGLTALVLAAVYFGLSRQLKPAPAFVPEVYRIIPEQESGLPFKEVVLSSESGNVQDEIKNQERRHTLAELRRLTFGTLGGLFLLSLGIGYVVAGRVLRPVDEITAAARRIQATSLSERIGLQGPQDE